MPVSKVVQMIEQKKRIANFPGVKTVRSQAQGNLAGSCERCLDSNSKNTHPTPEAAYASVQHPGSLLLTITASLHFLTTHFSSGVRRVLPQTVYDVTPVQVVPEDTMARVRQGYQSQGGVPPAMATGSQPMIASAVLPPSVVHPSVVHPAVMTQGVSSQPITPQPVAPQPVTPQPIAPQPIAPPPVAPQPVVPQPVMPQPVVPQPVVPLPVVPQPAGSALDVSASAGATLPPIAQGSPLSLLDSAAQ